MRNCSSRSLELLTLLQAGRKWSAEELSSRLEVAERTVRRDIARLRSLGYDIRSAPGPGGAYRLVPSVRIPPLLLTAEEVSALVAGLLILETGAQDAAVVSARSKLEQLLPSTLRRRAVTTAFATEVVAPSSDTVDWTLLGDVADAVENGNHLRFSYTDRHGRVSTRRVEPFRQVLRGGVWYLVCYDRDRSNWRLFRFDRIHDAASCGVPFGYTSPEFPSTSIQEWLATDFGRLDSNKRR